MLAKWQVFLLLHLVFGWLDIIFHLPSSYHYGHLQIAFEETKAIYHVSWLWVKHLGRPLTHSIFITKFSRGVKSLTFSSKSYDCNIDQRSSRILLRSLRHSCRRGGVQDFFTHDPFHFHGALFDLYYKRRMRQVVMLHTLCKMFI